MTKMRMSDNRLPLTESLLQVQVERKKEKNAPTHAYKVLYNNNFPIVVSILYQCHNYRSC